MTDIVLERSGFACDIEAGQGPCLSIQRSFLSDPISKLGGANAIQ